MEWNELNVKARYLDQEFTVARPALVIGGYGDHVTNSFAAVVLDWWLNLLPSGTRLTYLGTKSHTFRDVGPRVLPRIRGVLEKINEQQEFYMFKDAPEFDCGQHALELKWGTVANAPVVNVLYAAFPIEYLSGDGPDTIAKAFHALVDAVPLQHAGAGIGFNLVFGREWEQIAMPAIMAAARRYLGLDVRHRGAEARLSGKIKSAMWLTYLNNHLFDEASRTHSPDEALSDRVQRIPTKNGVILRSGAVPPAGDKNRGAEDVGSLREVNRFLVPIRQNTWGRTNLFRLDSFDSDAWFQRLDDRS